MGRLMDRRLVHTAAEQALTTSLLEWPAEPTRTERPEPAEREFAGAACQR
jgi:hypothetical protein